MINCDNIQNDLIFYIEGELPEDKKHAVEEHFRSCNHCNHLYDELRKTLIIIDHEKQIEPSKNFYETLTDKINQEEKPIRSLTYTLKQVLAYAAVIAIGIFIGSLTGVVLDNSSSQELSQNTQESIYWNDFMQEPIESFLVSE